MAHRIEFLKESSKTSEEVRESLGITKDLWTGTMFFGPEVGKSFTFYFDGEHINDGGYFHTSRVKNIEYVDLNIYRIKTQNSTYLLNIGKEVEPK